MAADQGLRAADAAARLAAEGYNELPRTGRRGIGRIAFDVATEPMFGLLLVAGVIYLILGDLVEALVLSAFATLSVGIAVVQESRSEHVLEALRDLSSPRALVVRDGQRRRIAGREVVRGDLVVLAEGERVPADGLLVTAHDLAVDESLLTGESVPVTKSPSQGAPDTPTRPGGDGLPLVFSGSLVVRGQGLFEVTATGPRSELGKIGTALGEIESLAPALTREVRRLVRVLALFGLAVTLATIILFGLTRGGWLDALLAGIAIGMSMLPEELPLVLTVFMVMGAWRISRARVLTRRASAIESLGSATVLCTDKTGTLTENRMQVAEVMADGRVVTAAELATGDDLPVATHRLIDHAVLASAVEPFDPMEKAFNSLRRAEAHDPRAGLVLVREWGVRPELLAMTQGWRRADEAHVIAAKGAPEAIAGLCHLDAPALAALRRDTDVMAARGLRVLAVAGAEAPAGEWPAGPDGFVFHLLGLVGLADPLRAEVPAAVAECRAAGIKVVMITGDYPATARAIATQAGLDAGQVLTGDELAALDEAGLIAAVRDTCVFARVMPDQKLRIVRAFKAGGAVVAMTGDGVNDAPSLKAADIGIAMGGRGTDVAREASSLVLLDDDFGAIVTAVRLGRRVNDNLRKAASYILAVHVPIAGLALLPLLFGFPIIFSPIHIAFLEMLIDPVCSIVFEAERAEDQVMRRPPRPPGTPLFSAGLVRWSVLQGVLALGVVVAIYAIATLRGMAETEVRALTFVTLILANIGLILVNRSAGASLLAAVTRPNRALVVVVGVVLSLLLLAVRWAPAEHLFAFGPLHGDDIAYACGAVVLLVVALEGLKGMRRGGRAGA